MKLVLYSGGDARDNRKLDRAMLKLSEKKSPKMSYIPYAHYESELYFKEFVDQYSALGANKFIHFPIDRPTDRIIQKEVWLSDIMHLSGGNTFYFLNTLRKSGHLNKIKKFVQRGGILTGLSAGAILMTPSIDTASFPEFDRDDNFENLKNLKAMNLVPFHFYPHYKNSARYEKAMKSFSKKIRTPLYACPDGAGIIVVDKQLTFLGKCFVFFQGHKTILY